MRTFKEYLAEKEEPTFIHYSHRDNLTHLYGGMSGSGIKGAEDERLKQSKDSRIKKRVYFYPQVAGGLPKPEIGLGPHTYEAKLSGMHDATKQSEIGNKIALSARERVAKGEHPSNAFESSVLDHGFKGYHTPNMSVVLNHDVPVKYVGSSVGKTFGTHSFDTKEKKKSIFGGIPNSSGEHTSSHLTSDQVSFWQQHKPDLQKAAPSAKMQYGQLTVHKDHLENLKTELEKHPNHPL
jgi:hypothetical protein